MAGRKDESMDRFFSMREEDEARVYRYQNESGDGLMTRHFVFPGVTLMYNDVHMGYFDSEFSTDRELLCIDYCREGRMEYEAGNGALSYVEAGDLKIDRRVEHRGHFSFPSAHYHGITIGLELAAAARQLPLEVRNFPVDLYEIRKKYCSGPHPRVIHDAPSINHIFQELYSVPEKIRTSYFKIKVLELLLYLDALEFPADRDRPYFYRSQVEKIKAIHRELTAHLDRRYTIQELSEQYQIPMTALKTCFKTVFGSPLHTYMRGLRMNQAAIYLKSEPETTVTEIAGRVGYDSSSKFAAAFKTVIGKTPVEYRNEQAGGGRSVQPGAERKSTVRLGQAGPDGV